LKIKITKATSKDKQFLMVKQIKLTKAIWIKYIEIKYEIWKRITSSNRTLNTTCNNKNKV